MAFASLLEIVFVIGRKKLYQIPYYQELDG
jgi:hypothetical protein